MRKTEVRLDGWCEGGLGQQRNNCGGCMSMRERSESGQPWYICNCMSFTTSCRLKDHPPHALVVITLRGVG